MCRARARGSGTTWLRVAPPPITTWKTWARPGGRPDRRIPPAPRPRGLPGQQPVAGVRRGGSPLPDPKSCLLTAARPFAGGFDKSGPLGAAGQESLRPLRRRPRVSPGRVSVPQICDPPPRNQKGGIRRSACIHINPRQATNLTDVGAWVSINYSIGRSGLLHFLYWCDTHSLR